MFNRLIGKDETETGGSRNENGVMGGRKENKLNLYITCSMIITRNLEAVITTSSRNIELNISTQRSSVMDWLVRVLGGMILLYRCSQSYCQGAILINIHILLLLPLALF